MRTQAPAPECVCDCPTPGSQSGADIYVLAPASLLLMMTDAKINQVETLVCAECERLHTGYERLSVLSAGDGRVLLHYDASRYERRHTHQTQAECFNLSVILSLSLSLLPLTVHPNRATEKQLAQPTGKEAYQQSPAATCLTNQWEPRWDHGNCSPSLTARIPQAWNQGVMHKTSKVGEMLRLDERPRVQHLPCSFEHTSPQRDAPKRQPSHFAAVGPSPASVSFTLCGVHPLLDDQERLIPIYKAETFPGF
ncbi:uncharacterized protein V6R79_000871 [Siganus canaliculatus]